MRWLVVLECLARFLYEETNLHVALVPLLPVCRALAAWHTALQDWLDNTVRAVAQYQLAFAVGPSAVTRPAHAAQGAPGGHWHGVSGRARTLARGGLEHNAAARRDVASSPDRTVLPDDNWVCACGRGRGSHHVRGWTPCVLVFVRNQPLHRGPANRFRNFFWLLWGWKRGAVLSDFFEVEGCF